MAERGQASRGALGLADRRDLGRGDRPRLRLADRPKHTRAGSPDLGSDVLLALDIGSSGARAAVFDLDGHRHLEFRRPYPTLQPRPGWAEQDPRAWRSGALATLGLAIRAIGRRRRVLAIGLTGQCPSVVAVDARGAPVGPGLMYRDNRAVTEARWMIDEFGAREIHARTGHLPAAFHVAPKILWWREHDPRLYEAARQYLQPRDFLALVLTGELATDPTHAAATLLFNLRARRWDSEILGRLGLAEERLPPVRDSWAIVGELRPALVRRFGLERPIPVVLGGADSQACAFGAGVVSPGPVSEMAGSSTCLNTVVATPLDCLAVTHYAHVVPGGFTTETGINTTGAAIDWLADLISGGRGGRAATADYARLDAEAAATIAGADGVLANPVLGDGERTDPDLRGAFTGLSSRHGRGVLMRALLEGVAFAIRAQLDLLTGSGAPVEELRISGGDSRLRTWNQVKADVTGLPVATIAGDAAVTGVAMLAGLGIGLYPDADAAIARCFHVLERYEPDASHAPILDDRYRAWQELASSAAVRRPSNAPEGGNR